MTRRLFQALHHAARKQLADHVECTLALARAAHDLASIEDVEAAQAALDALPVDVRSALLADAHRTMRTDLSAFGLAPDNTASPGRTLN